MIRRANGLLIGGMACIVVGITLSVALVLDVVLGACPRSSSAL